MTDLVNHFVTSVGAGGIAIGATSLPVFPEANPLLYGKEINVVVGTRVQIESGTAEIMRATISAGEWDVERAVEDSAIRPARAHAAGEIVVPALTAGQLRYELDDIRANLSINVFTPETMAGFNEVDRIKAAISAAQTVRGRVEFQRGKTYTLPTPAVDLTATFLVESEMTLDFNGAKIVCDTRDLATYRHLFKVGTADTIAENVTFKNGQFDGLMTNRAAPEAWTWIVPHHVRNFKIEDCLFDRTQGDACSNGEQAIGVVDGLHMSGCNMRRSNGQLCCVASPGSTDIRVEGNRFSEHMNLDVEGGEGTAPEVVFIVYAERVSVTGNTFTDGGPIAVYGGADVTITGNTVKTNGFQQGCISVADLVVGFPPRRVVITGNVLDGRRTNGNGHAGVFINTTAEDVVVSGNLIVRGAKAHGIHGVTAAGAVVTGNLITGGDGTRATDIDIIIGGNGVVVSGNRCKSPGASISVDGDNSTITGNVVGGCIATSGNRHTITGNRATAVGLSPISGIALSIEVVYPSSHHVIQGNNVPGWIYMWGTDSLIVGNISGGILDVVGGAEGNDFAMRNRYGLNVPQATGLHATSTQPL